MIEAIKLRLNDRLGSAALTTRHPYIHKSWGLISPISGSGSVGILGLRTKDKGVCLFLLFISRQGACPKSRFPASGYNPHCISRTHISLEEIAKLEDVINKVILKNAAFWDVTPCGSCKNRRFIGT
jgi:hypothetical protein